MRCPTRSGATRSGASDAPGLLRHRDGDPTSQDSQDGRWYVSDTEHGPDLVRALQAQAAVTSSVVRAHELSDIGRPGKRWEGAAPPTLERVLFHLLQEYARHAGHLDVVRELITARSASSARTSPSRLPSPCGWRGTPVPPGSGVGWRPVRLAALGLILFSPGLSVGLDSERG